MRTGKAYMTNLSDLEWQCIEPLLPDLKRLSCKIEYSRREILNAIFCLNRNGCVHNIAGKEPYHEYLWSSSEQRLLQQGAPRGILPRGLLPIASRCESELSDEPLLDWRGENDWRDASRGAENP